MFGVYEVYTWDDVSYTKVAEYEKEADAIKEKDRLKEERAKVFKPSSSIPTDPMTYTVMSDLQYYLLMKND